MKQFIELLTIWLQNNALSGDSKIYTKKEWHARQEAYHNEADYVITTEGGLFMILNFGDPYNLTYEFSDLLESFNYYYELGDAWNLGLYKIDEKYQKQTNPLSYAEKLRHPLWQKKRSHILQRAGYACEDCKAQGEPLDVHHCYYIFGIEPWQYPFDALKALCRSCHLKRSAIEKVFRASLQTLTHTEILSLKNVLETIFWNYDRESFFLLLQTLLYDKSSIETKLAAFLESKRQQ